ncbi:shikimate dehydrogenase [Kribbella capetownensis]|uniref:Shikimate dehydrogenase (NADP(+)) n=1 Tax=Kribbella capetownensis TaxID=1572659 RepID=A0A4R0JV91_9ACTN|nr:shikimate dehydrogenase [Kribbella capetownensis]TCC50600.1 shikimate dehydrogenase [Kribbella capetownensis]
MKSYLIGLIGSGIGASFSPALHETEAARLGLPYVYRLLDIDVLRQDLGELLEQTGRLGYDGLNVTHPCKQTIIAQLDELSDEAARLGAVNTVLFRDGRTVGHNTDRSGFAAAFGQGLPGAAKDRIVQLGAGGAGAAVADALLGLGAGCLTIVDPEPGRAAALVERLGDRRAHSSDQLPDLAIVDGLVNTTPVGMTQNPGLPLPVELLRPRLWVADIVYRPLETELLKQAGALGCRTLDGGGMAVLQAAHALRLFTGRTPDSKRMLEHLKELASW